LCFLTPVLDVILHVLQVCEETRMVVKDFHKQLDILRACRKGEDDADIDDLVSQLMERPLVSMDDVESFTGLLSDRQ